MTQEDLNEILAKHKLWLEEKEEGERANLQGANLQRADMRRANLQGANLQCADMQGANLQCADMQDANLQCADMRRADMQGADMQCADMQCADMQCADMRRADMQGADMQGANLQCADMQDANIDYSAWPLWCGSLKAHVDDRIAIQLLYHTLSVVQHSPYVSENIKRTLLAPDVVEVANRFHRVDECGKLEIFNGGANE